LYRRNNLERSRFDRSKNRNNVKPYRNVKEVKAMLEEHKMKARMLEEKKRREEEEEKKKKEEKEAKANRLKV
jgi:hypothetical protein